MNIVKFIPMRWSCLFILYFTLSYRVFPQESPDKINMAYFYQAGNELLIDYVYTTDNLLRISYKYKDPLLLSVYYVAWESEKSKKSVKNELLTSACNEKDCLLTLQLDSFANENYHTLIFRDEESKHEYVFPIMKNIGTKSPILLSDSNLEWLPDRFLTPNTFVTPQALDNSALIFVYYYNDSFTPAGPPTGLRKGQPNIQADSTFTVLSHTAFELSKPGLYLMQTDTNSVNAFSISVFENPFPEFKTLKQLIGSMEYLSTAEESQLIKEKEPNKNTFEGAWIKMAGTEPNAKAGIRYYFRGINQSNTLFTTYKEGWKTDQGMIYTIFGPPIYVRKIGFTEVWGYDRTQNHDNLEFTFSHYPIIFSQYHSILHRDAVFSTPWNRTVDRLRRGTPNYE